MIIRRPQSPPAARAKRARIGWSRTSAGWTWSAACTAVLALVQAACGGGDGESRLHFRDVPSPAGPRSSAPALQATEEGPILSWVEDHPEDGAVVRIDRWREGAWEGAREVARGRDLHVDWADVPSAIRTSGDRLAALWLVRGDAGGYGIRTAFSDDEGRSWSAATTPHEDVSPVEHGFATLLDLGPAGAGVVWLDGRARSTDSGESAGSAGPPSEVALRFRALGPGGPAGSEEVIDRRTCECCHTDAAWTSRGLVVVYRDRSPEEVRDVHRVRYVDGRWEEPAPVHRDEWVFGACPVNGPAVAARDSAVAVAWFTGAGGTPRTQVAFSDDAGGTFGPPLRVDDGWPGGRVDVVWVGDAAFVSWLERTGGGAEIRVRRVSVDGRAGEAATVGATTSGASSGFPRMAASGDDEILVAWTDAQGAESRVRVARAVVAEPSSGSGEGP